MSRCTQTLERFNEMIEPLLQRMAAPVTAALSEAGCTAAQLADVEIVGGGTRVSAVKRRLGQLLGLDPEAQNFGLRRWDYRLRGAVAR